MEERLTLEAAAAEEAAGESTAAAAAEAKISARRAALLDDVEEDSAERQAKQALIDTMEQWLQVRSTCGVACHLRWSV